MSVGLLTTSRMDRAPLSAQAPLDPSEHLLLRGAIWIRWIGMLTAGISLLIDRGDLQKAGTALVSVIGLLAVTIGASALANRDMRLARHPALLMLEVCVGLAVTVADGWCFYGDHALTISALATMWSLAVIGSVGVSFGAVAGAAAGVAFTLARLVGATAPDEPGFFSFESYRPQSAAGAVVIVAITVGVGAGAGTLRNALRTTHGRAAAVRARQDMAATLHDGVLQALAYIIRRSADPDIARVARDADIELRAHLALPADPAVETLASAITRSARRAEHQLGCHLELAIDDELRTPSAETTAALTGAVTEAITNAAKHAEASMVTVFATSDQHGIQISVTDNGEGFDPAAVPAGGGLDQSLRARMRNVGGEAKIKSTVGHGTTIELWAP